MTEPVLIAVIVASAALALVTIVCTACVLGTGSTTTIDRWLEQRGAIQKARAECEAAVKKAEALHRERCPRLDDTPRKPS